jgi:hypothetical protein
VVNIKLVWHQKLWHSEGCGQNIGSVREILLLAIASEITLKLGNVKKKKKKLNCLPTLQHQSSTGLLIMAAYINVETEFWVYCNKDEGLYIEPCVSTFFSLLKTILPDDYKHTAHACKNELDCNEKPTRIRIRK